MIEDQRDTRERLLDAAERLFADHGYDAVPVRDIATAANVNVAAINYHFHGKDRLYQEVLRRVITAKRDRNLAALDAAHARGGNDLESIIGTFFRTHFEDTLKSEAGRNFLKLFVREMHHGSPEGLQAFQELLQPMWERVGRAVLASLPEADPALVPLIVGSLHGQLIHFTMRWHTQRDDQRDDQGDSGVPQTMRRFFPPLAEDVDRYIDLAVDHITRFSVAGILAVATHHSGEETS